MKHPFRIIVLTLILLAIVLWGGAIVKCEILTRQHGWEFDGLWKDTMLIDPEYWKVLDYRDENASVYFVAPEGKGGTVLYFQRETNEWILTEWGPSWSKSGSADDLIWPYIR